MRKEGASLREIAFALRVSLSSASVWVRDVPRGSERDERQEPPPEAPIDEATEPDRECGSCKRLLPATAFNKHPKGRQHWCRECFSAYFRKRGELHREQTAASRRSRRKAASDYVADYKRGNPCIDCGERDPIVLEFDHVDDKRAAISILVNAGASIEQIQEEIERCDLVCVNCHRLRTGERGNWRRAHKPWWRSPPPKRHETARNFAYLYSYLERTPCIDCGEADLCVLECDHRGRKGGGVTTLARSGVSLGRLEEEISLCDVRCGNCHRRRTWRQQRQRQRRS